MKVYENKNIDLYGKRKEEGSLSEPSLIILFCFEEFFQYSKEFSDVTRRACFFLKLPGIDQKTAIVDLP